MIQTGKTVVRPRQNPEIGFPLMVVVIVVGVWALVVTGDLPFGLDALEALFSGLAFAAVVMALLLQWKALSNTQREISSQTKALERQVINFQADVGLSNLAMAKDREAVKMPVPDIRQALSRPVGTRDESPADVPETSTIQQPSTESLTLSKAWEDLKRLRERIEVSGLEEESRRFLLGRINSAMEKDKSL